MKISVVTPSFNQAPYLERTLQSVHSQSGPFVLEHIVIDGGSTDGSVEILERWAEKLWYVSEPDSGQSHALNKGIQRATGEVIAWLNSDDILLPGALARVAEYFDIRPDMQWAYGQCRIIDERDNEVRRVVTSYKNFLGRRYNYEKLLVENYISQPATFFRKSLYMGVGGADERLHLDMDYDLWLRFGRIADAGIIPAELAGFRFYSGCKTGGQIERTLRVAHEIAQKYSNAIGKPWLGTINYWMYYKRTAFIYKLADALQSRRSAASKQGAA